MGVERGLDIVDRTKGFPVPTNESLRDPLLVDHDVARIRRIVARVERRERERLAV